LTATVPPRTPLVMPAIEPGWEKFLRVPPSSSPRAQPRLLSGFLFPLRDSHLSRRVVVTVSAAVVAVTLACTLARFDTHRVPVRLCACAHCEVRPLALVTHTLGAVMSACRAAAVLPRGCRSAHSRGVKAKPLRFLAIPRCSPRARPWTPPAENPLLTSSRRRERQPEPRHGRVAERSQAMV
jgi:hypothetical protein